VEELGIRRKLCKNIVTTNNNNKQNTTFLQLEIFNIQSYFATIIMTLLIETMTAYLGPLLKKHTAGEALVWEDLAASHVACLAVLRRQSNNPFVLVS
jgi:hypothetical protein